MTTRVTVSVDPGAQNTVQVDYLLKGISGRFKNNGFVHLLQPGETKAFYVYDTHRIRIKEGRPA